jgi:arginase family enzyme
MVTLLGIPLDENSSFLEGARFAPQAIRDALHSTSTNYCTESGIDLQANKQWKDAGDLMLAPMPEAMAEIEFAVKTKLNQGIKFYAWVEITPSLFPLSKRWLHRIKT